VHAGLARRWLLLAPPTILLLAKGVAQLALAAIQLGLEPTDAGAILLAVLGASSLLAALALLAGRRLGWLLALSVLGWDLTTGLVLWWQGTANYAAMALSTVSALALTAPVMRRLYAPTERR
jgi:hypothetical protein